MKSGEVECITQPDKEDEAVIGNGDIQKISAFVKLRPSTTSFSNDGVKMREGK